MRSEDEILRNRIMDLANTASERNIYTNSSFLTPPEQDVFLSIRHELPVRAELFGGNDSCIRKIAVFGSEEDFGYAWESPIRILHIRPKNEKFAEELSHRDYLGSMMALGMERKVTGDIIVRGKEAWVCVLDSAADYIMKNLLQVRHTDVVCEPVTGEVPELAPSFENRKANIASERLDLIIGAAAGVKRESAKKLLDGEKVFVNGRLVNSPGFKMKPGSEFVIRGYGKFIFDGVDATTKKGRLVVGLRKYL